MSIQPAGIAISGMIASGKTTVARELVAQLGWKYIGLGDYLRHEAISLGRTPSRETLQDLGSKMVFSDPHEFCVRALQHFGWQSGTGVIIDGLRNMEVLDQFRSIFSPMRLFLVYCTASGATRKERVDSREPGLGTRLAILEKHRIESDAAKGLPALADLTVDTSQNPNQTTSTVLQWLESHQRC